MHPLEKYVTIDKEIIGGIPVFKGTRVSVKTLFDCLEESSLDEFLLGHPSVSREQAEAVIERGSGNFLNEMVKEGIADYETGNTLTFEEFINKRGF
jgi:uncharacterized protein (DUF433 family)